MVKQDLHNTNSNTIQAQMWEGLMKFHLCLSSCWYLVTVGGMGAESVFFSNVVTVKPPHAPGDGPTAIHTASNSCGLQNTLFWECEQLGFQTAYLNFRLQCMCVCVCVYTCHATCVEDKGKLSEASSFPSPSEARGLSIADQTQQQAPLLTESDHHPTCAYLRVNDYFCFPELLDHKQYL